jgi:excisionase family DNA binding protein
MVHRGELPHVKFGRSLRFKKSELIKYIKAHEVIPRCP